MLGTQVAHWYDERLRPAAHADDGRPAAAARLVRARPPDDPLQPIVAATPMAVFTSGLNMTGQPAISLPLHTSEAGLPIGVQLVAPYGREDVLLRVAAQVEEAAPWADRLPPVRAGLQPASS